MRCEGAAIDGGCNRFPVSQGGNAGWHPARDATMISSCCRHYLTPQLRCFSQNFSHIAWSVSCGLLPSAHVRYEHLSLPLGET
jgi:hypothetical protein